MNSPHRVVIIGGGFGGLNAARYLKHAPVQVTLIDRRNFHLFQPLLYQVASGQLSPANIASPLRSVLKYQKNAEVLMAEVTGFDLQKQEVCLGNDSLPFDTLVIAAGSRHHYFGHAEWEKDAPGLKTIEDATNIRHRILEAFEMAEREQDPMQRHIWLTFVVVGAGPTGTELAGALAELSRDTLRDDFRSIDPREAQIWLLDAAPRVLPSYADDLSQKAYDSLHRLGINIRLGAQVTDVKADRIAYKIGDRQEQIMTRTVLWAAGVQPSPLARMVIDQAGLTPDRSGRVPVGPYLTVPGYDHVFVIGDMAGFKNEKGQLLPAVAPVAIQQGKYVAGVIERRGMGGMVDPFVYHDYGTMSTIGRAKAVADLGWIHLNGFSAWWVWLFIHLLYLVEFENRILVLLQWAWYYFSWNRSARLITGGQSQTHAD